MPQLTACFYLELLMRIYFFSVDRSHQRVNSIAVRKVNAHQDLEMKTSGQRNLGAMRVKLTKMLSIFTDSLGRQVSRFEPVVGHGCSPKANLIFSSLPGKMPGLKQVKSLQIMRRTQTFKVIRREGATPTNSNRPRLFV